MDERQEREENLCYLNRMLIIKIQKPPCFHKVVLICMSLRTK
jgi:hypothetical protein